MPKISLAIPDDLEPLARRLDVDPARLVYFTLPLDARDTIGAQAFNTVRIQVLPYGEPRMVDDRKLKVEETDLALVLGDLGTRKNEVAILYEHGAGPRGGIAAGWMARFSADVASPSLRGLFADAGWTKQATSEIRSEEWKYLSPGFFGVYDDDGFIRPRVLFEVSLTNTPAIDGMLPVAASVVRGVLRPAVSPPAGTGTATTAPPSTVTVIPPEPTASPEPARAEVEGQESNAHATQETEVQMDMKKLAALLGLPAEATEAEILKAIADGTEGQRALKAELETVRQEKAEAEIKAKEKVAADARKAKVDAVLASAEKAGKITAAGREQARKLAEADPDAFAALMETAPRVAPVAPVVDRSVRTETPAPSSRAELLATVTAYANRNGISLRRAYAVLAARGVVN